MSFIYLPRYTRPLKGSVTLPSSKSESNRALIMQALSQGNIKLLNVGDANDSQVMQRALKSANREVNVEDAGTVMRFLTAYYCVTGQHKILSGTERMHNRPIGDLVDALRNIGFRINYKGAEGFPPLEILPTHGKLKNKVSIPADVSSQFVSALMMIAPKIPGGLTIQLKGKVASEPYIMLTERMMRFLGIEVARKGTTIAVAEGTYKKSTFIISPDWTSASYWYSLVAMPGETEIMLKGLSDISMQGDRILMDWYKQFGVETEVTSEGTLLRKSGSELEPLGSFDFTDHPDLAMSVIVTCAGLRLAPSFTGMESLRIKESDRIRAMQFELKRFGATLWERPKNNFHLRYKNNVTRPITRVLTHRDHRIAMAFAPLLRIASIEIANPEVVDKSYPQFFDELQQLLP